MRINIFLKAKQSGLTLIEVLAGLFVVGLVLIMFNQLTNTLLDNTKANLTATYEASVATAAQSYIQANYSAITGIATSTTPALITIQTLINAGYLQSGFSSSNPYQQTTCVLVLQPTSNQLQGLVISELGTTIDDVMLGSISANMGAAGGGIYSTTSTAITGAGGGWSTAVSSFNGANAAGTNCSGLAGNVSLAKGHPAYSLWFSNGNIASAFLYRNAIPGSPNLNTMNTPIIMASTQTVGSACTTTGSIAVNTQGQVISCQSGTWQQQSGSSWLAPVSSYANLPTTDATGSVRVTLDTSRTFIWNGSAWSALSVDQNGNFSDPGKTSTGLVALTAAPASSGGSCSSYGIGVIARDSSGNIYVCK